MVLDEKKILKLVSEGKRLFDSKGQLITIKPEEEKPSESSKEESQIAYLKLIAGLLGRLISRPDPKWPEMKAPEITVHPPEVIVKPPIIPAPPKPIRHWHFKLTKNFNGQTTEVDATAIE